MYFQHIFELSNIVSTSSTSYKGSLGGENKVWHKVFHFEDKDFGHNFVYGVAKANRPKVAD